jgi:hypothetical protein
MFPRLKFLFLQQTTPDEVIVFLLLTILITLAMAFLLYAAFLLVFWRARLKRVVPLRSLLFPPRKQLWAYAPEYVLVAATSLLLSLTILERNDVVRMIHEMEIGRLPASAAEAVRGAMPFYAVDDSDARGDGGSPDSVTSAVVAVLKEDRASLATLANVGAIALLRPMLAAGESGRTMLAVRSIAEEVGPSAWSKLVSRNRLLIATCLLLLLYAAWLALRRGRAVQKDPATSTDYRRMAGRLVVPCLCIGLLLISAASVGDPERQVRSAVAAAGIVDLSLDGEAVAEAVRGTMVRQAVQVSRLRPLISGDDSIVSVGALAGRISSAEGTLESLAATLGELRRQGLENRRISEEALQALATGLASADSARLATEIRLEAADAGAARRLDALEERMAAMRTDFARLGSDLAGRVEIIEELRRRMAGAEGSILALQAQLRALEARLPAVPTTGTLFVAAREGDSYQIRRQGAETPAVSGSWTGIHALQPGSYVVTVGRTRQPVTATAAQVAPAPQIVTITAGGVFTVLFR